MRNKTFVAIALTVFIFVAPGKSRADSLQIYSTDSPPTNYTENGKFTGIITDIVNELRKSTGTTAEIEVVPVARAVEYVGSKPNVMVFTFAKTPAREQQGFHFLGPVITRAHSLWKKKGSVVSVSSLADVKKQNLTVGAELGDFRSKLLADEGIAVENVAGSELNLKKLMADRIPLMVSSNLEMPAIAKNAGVDLNSLEIAYVISEASSFLMFSKETDQATLDKWQAAYVALQKTDFFTKTAEKWGPMLGTSFKFSPEKGFYIP